MKPEKFPPFNIQNYEFDVKTEEHSLEVEQIEREIIRKTTLPEQLSAGKTTKVIERGIENPEAYETFQVDEVLYSTDKEIWISFPGLGDGTEPLDLDAPAGHIITPRRGRCFIFSGPAGIAGVTPEQSMRCADQVADTVIALLEKYPGYKINIAAFSAGTFLAPNIARRISEEFGDISIDNTILIAPGTAIGMGIFSTEVTEPLSDKLYKDGLDKYSYSEQMTGYNQRDPQNVFCLPKNKKTKIFYGKLDRFIPYDGEGGTLDYIKILQSMGIDPEVHELPWADHVTMVAYLHAAKDHLNEDVYGLGPVSTKSWLESEYRDEYISEIESRLDSKSDSELRTLASVMIPPRSRWESELRYTFLEGTRSILLAECSPEERVVMDYLIKKGIVHKQVSGRNFDFYVLDPVATNKFNYANLKSLFTQYAYTDADVPTDLKTRVIGDLLTVTRIHVSNQVITPQSLLDQQPRVDL